MIVLLSDYLLIRITYLLQNYVIYEKIQGINFFAYTLVFID